jgi:hypothetical protein
MDTALLVQLMAEKLDRLSQLRMLGERQLDLVRLGDLTRLLQVLAEKQKHIDALAEVHRNLAPFQADTPDGRNWNSEDDRLNCARMLEVCETLRQEILQQERHCESELVARRDATALQAQEVQSATIARSAYRPQYAPHVRKSGIETHG